MKLSKILLSAIVALALFLPVPADAESPEAQRQIEAQVRAWLESLEAAAGTNTLSQSAATLGADNLLGTKAVGTYTCLPTCGTTDGKFLSIAGDDLQTLAGDGVLLRIRVPAGTASFEVGFFDGDSGGTWDLPGAGGVPLDFTLYEDPDGDGVGPVAGYWSGSSLPDNAWSSAIVSTSSGAQLPSGAFDYALEIRSTNFTAPSNWSNFKVRTSGSLATNVTVSPVAIAFTAPLFSGREGFILYPNAGSGDFVTTTYDGSWAFYLEAFSTPTEMELWDGDFDRGTRNVPSTYDTDDPNTPGAPFIPSWAVGTAARPEGVAFVLVCGSESSATGCPADDRGPTTIDRRSPSIEFRLIDPDGAAYYNGNPSGNREWEQFLVSTAPFDPTLMDYSSPSLPPGVYQVQADGIDLNNLNAWRFFNAVLGVCEDGTPCVDPPRPYLIGDTVFFDVDGDGVQDPGEPGISGVTVTAYDWAGHAVGTAITGTDGLYSIGVEAGTFTVEVDASNFGSGGALEGLSSTTGDSLTFTVVDDNVLTYDFGYNTGLGETGPGCQPCEGKVSSLTFVYQGSGAAQVTITGRRGPDKATPLFSGVLLPGEIFTIDGPPTGNGGFAGTLGTEISIVVNGTPHATVHTSCSQPIGPGTVAGDFEVLAGASKNGGDLCPLEGGGGGGGEEPPPPPPTAEGTGTLGYWKNHPEGWPVTSLTLGGVTYGRNDAIALMGTASKGDKSYDMFHQLAAAKLNVLAGNESSCIDATIAAADAWLAAHPPGSKVKGKDWGSSGGEALHSTLDDYNNGRLCAPHRG
jgi:hypothetical protein